VRLSSASNSVIVYHSLSCFLCWPATGKIFSKIFSYQARPQFRRFMKILLVHPDDSVEVGAWAGTRWDLAVDLGWSGRHAYSRQTERLGFRVFSIYDLLDHAQHRRRMREILALGLDQLLDSESVDWWDLFSAYAYPQLEQLMLLSALAEQIPEHAEIFATSPHLMLRALSLLLSREIKSFSVDHRTSDCRTGFRARSRRYLKAAFALRPSQVTEIAFDKWDTDYRIRRHFAHPAKTSSTPAILLPSAYANVSRAQVAYARMLPHSRFLLVVTRRNGRLQELPGNVELRSLASYASRSLPSTGEERVRLLARWREVQNVLFDKNHVLGLARKLHVFDGFPSFLKRGLRVRDAWREVFVREPITAVLSADENNPFTRMPILLARSRKLRTVFCDHGALNMSFGVRPPVSDAYLMSGDMARDYSVSWCGLSAGKIVVGGPAEASHPPPPSDRTVRDWIVFYSEAYELSSRRTQTFYAELLPELCSLASRTNRKVVLKLHPFESLRVRKLLVGRVLSAEQRALVEIRQGPMAPDLFARAWCSITVESSVAVENTLKGVPCFLCSWFDASWYDYGKQYAKYSAGYPLESPTRIREIPHLLERLQITEATRRSLRTSISPNDLESVLSGI
jgi:hypothetical protein